MPKVTKHRCYNLAMSLPFRPEVLIYASPLVLCLPMGLFLGPVLLLILGGLAIPIAILFGCTYVSARLWRALSDHKWADAIAAMIAAGAATAVYGYVISGALSPGSSSAAVEAKLWAEFAAAALACFIAGHILLALSNKAPKVLSNLKADPPSLLT